MEQEKKDLHLIQNVQLQNFVACVTQKECVNFF